MVSLSSSGFSDRNRYPSPNSGCPVFSLGVVVQKSAGLMNNLHFGLGFEFFPIPLK
jgi:hypothetical protein